MQISEYCVTYVYDLTPALVDEVQAKLMIS